MKIASKLPYYAQGIVRVISHIITGSSRQHITTRGLRDFEIVGKIHSEGHIFLLRKETENEECLQVEHFHLTGHQVTITHFAGCPIKKEGASDNRSTYVQ